MTHTEIVPGGLSAKFKFRVCQTTVKYREAYGSSPRPFNAMLLGKFTHNPDEMVLDMVSAASEEARDAYLRVGYRKIIKPWFEVDNAGRTTATYRVLAVAPNLETPLLNADGRPYMKAASLLDHARAIGADVWQFGCDFNCSGDRQQWAYAGRSVRRAGLPYPALRGANQLLNASGALAALESLADRLPLSQKAVREGLLKVEIQARFQVLPGRPTTVFDVAHNPHAAAVLAENLDRMGFFPVTHAVFGMLRDKDIVGVVKALGSRIDHWHVVGTPGPRGAAAEDIAALLRSTPGIGGASITVHASIADAYATAESEADADDRILAFGSFLTVAEVMRAIRARPAAAVA